MKISDELYSNLNFLDKAGDTISWILNSNEIKQQLFCEQWVEE